MTDEVLHARWKTGDPRAGEELYRRHGRSIKEFFRVKVHSDDDVADLVQDTFFRFQRATLPEKTLARAWLYGIATNVFLEHCRSETRGKQHDDVDELLGRPLMAAADSDPDYVIQQTYERRLLMKSLRRIQLRYQLVLELSRWGELTQEEIAPVLGCPAATVGRWKSEAIEALKVKAAELVGSPVLDQATTMSIARWCREMEEKAVQFGDERRNAAEKAGQHG